MKPLILILTAALPLCAAPAEGPQEGLWRPQSATLGGKPLPAEVLKLMSLRLEGNRYEVMFGAQVDKGTWKLLPGGKVKAMDVTGIEGPNKGKTIPAIVRVKGGTMSICYGLNGKGPEEFKADRPDLHLVIYKRQKE